MTTTARTGEVGLWTGPKVDRAPGRFVVLVLDLMFVMPESAPSVTMFELHAPRVNAKEAPTAERTVKTALWRVVVDRAAIVSAVCKMGVMAMVRAGTTVRIALVFALVLVLDLIVAVKGSAVGSGVDPELWTAHPGGPPQNISIWATTEMTCPNLREIVSGRGWGFSLRFSQRPDYLFELFALDGFICLAHLGRLLSLPAFGLKRGLLTAGTPSPWPFDKTNYALD